LEYIENRGQVAGADPAAVSQQAKKRQINQIGTLGSGNHYLEVQYVEEIFDWETAKIFGLAPQQILVSIHCGSRGLGHQIGTDYLKILEAAAKKYQIPIRERELVCAPISSPEGRQYFAAVNAGINCAFANRQVITHLTRQSFARIMGVKPESITTFYEVGHNTVKQEKHLLDGVGKELMVHRKGATRAFGPGNLEVPAKYRPVGQPVLIGGTMGTHSYILHGTAQGMAETFGSACHGAGRAMSRMAAIKTFRADNLVQNLKNQGIIIKGHSKAGLAEEAPESYKDVDLVVNVMHEAGIIRKVAKLKPLICIKG
jgi:tRNA-splicing ligase RtcB